jgi:predicted outer membrane protein
MMPSLEEKKNKLKQLREFHKNYEIEAIREHEKKYNELHDKSKEK